MSFDLTASAMSLSLSPMPLNFSSKSFVAGSVSFGAIVAEQEIDRRVPFVANILFTSNFDCDQQESLFPKREDLPLWVISEPGWLRDIKPGGLLGSSIFR